MDKCIEEYKKANDMVRSVFSYRVDMSFSGDLNKFNDSCVEFINFIKKCVENVSDNETYVLYMLRSGKVALYKNN